MKSFWVVILIGIHITTTTTTMSSLKWEWVAESSMDKVSHRQYGRMGLWNVSGLGGGCGKVEAIIDEMGKRDIDVMFMTEVWRMGHGITILEGGYLLMHSGGDVKHYHGVGVILSPRVAAAWNESGCVWNPISDRLMTVRIPTGPGRIWKDQRVFQFIYAIVAYSPTEPGHYNVEAIEAADMFYKDLHNICANAPSRDCMIVAGDFNARVGTYRAETSAAVGRYGGTATTSNGGRLINVAMENDLCIPGSFFRHKKIHKITWRNLKDQPPWRRKSASVPECMKQGNVGHVIDRFLVPQLLFIAGGIRDVRSFNGTDVDKMERFKSMDHALVVMTVAASSRTLRKQRPHTHVKKCRIIDKGKLGDPECIEAFVNRRKGQSYVNPGDNVGANAIYGPYQSQLVEDFMEIFGNPPPRSKAWMSKETMAAVQLKKIKLRELCQNRQLQLNWPSKSREPSRRNWSMWISCGNTRGWKSS